MPGAPMLPSFPLMPCETDSTEMRTDDGELLTLTVLHPTAHLGAWDPLLPFWARRSWQTLRGQTDREVGDNGDNEKQMCWITPVFHCELTWSPGRPGSPFGPAAPGGP